MFLCFLLVNFLNPNVKFVCISLSFGCLKLLSYCMGREAAKLTNVGQLLERCGKEFLGSSYKDPISSFSDFQEFSVSNPEVVLI